MHTRFFRYASGLANRPEVDTVVFGILGVVLRERYGTADAARVPRDDFTPCGWIRQTQQVLSV
jgi:hypothetical protein